MPTIQAFRGLRYDLGHVGALSEVIAPPRVSDKIVIVSLETGQPADDKWKPSSDTPTMATTPDPNWRLASSTSPRKSFGATP